MANLGDQPSAPDPEIGHGVSTEGRLGLVLRAFANAPLDADTPQLLISQAVAATGSSGGVVCGERGDRLVVLASEGYTPAQRTACGSLMLGDLSLPLTYAATTGQPVFAEAGAVSAGAEFANIAVPDAGAGRSATVRVHHASSLVEDVAQRYAVIPLDDSTPLGTVLRSGDSGDEVWLGSLSDIGKGYPALLEDTIAAGLASTASLALYGRDRRVIGAMGVAWAQAQAFSDAQKDQVRVVAQLAADALGRAQLLEAERAARQRTERLQQTMTALVASASLAEVTAAAFQHGLPPFGASAARLALADQQQPGAYAERRPRPRPDSRPRGPARCFGPLRGEHAGSIVRDRCGRHYRPRPKNSPVLPRRTSVPATA